MKLQALEDRLLNPMMQVGMMVLVSFVLTFLSIRYLSQLHNFDPLPSLIGRSEEPSNLIKIRTGLFVNNFLNFDLIKNEFTVLGTVWFEFDQKEVSLEVLEQSMFSKGEAEGQASLRGKYEVVVPVVQRDGDRVYAQYPVKIDFITNLDYKLFPFDSHRLYMTLNNVYLDADKFEFIADQDSFTISPNLLIFGWEVAGQQVYVGAASKPLTAKRSSIYPRVIYAIDFKRNSFKDLLLLLLPLLVSFFMGMFTFSYNHETYRSSILSIGIATVSAMMAYRYVISNNSPHVPYFMIVDWLFVLFLLLSFTVFLINVFDLFTKQRGMVVAALYLILIGTWCALLYWWA